MPSIFNVPLDLSSGIVVKNLPNSQFHNEMQTQHMLPNPQQKEMCGGWRMRLGQAFKLNSRMC